MAVTTELPHDTVWTLANSIVASSALHVVAELGIADHVDGVPVSGAELARRCGAQAEPLDRLLRLLAAHGVFAVHDAGYTHTDASRLLRSDHPASMRDFARLLGLPLVVEAFGALSHSVVTGAPAAQVVGAAGFFHYLQEHPREAAVFDQAMSAKARGDIAAILAAYDFGPFPTIADIGGGRGHLLNAVLQATPTASGVLFDLPHVVSRLDAQQDRLRAQAGDFFADPLPGADAYILMEVIHDWPDERAVAILRAIRDAACPGATVLVVEDVIPDESVDVRSLTLDVLMLAVTGGRERTVAQLSALMTQAAFRRTRVIETSGSMRIVEGVAV